MLETRLPTPPFTHESASVRVRLAEDSWNTRDPRSVALAYTNESRWRNRSKFLSGRDRIVAFLSRKWDREKEYRLVKKLWAYAGNRIAVRFAYGSHDAAGSWCRAYGKEDWLFDGNGLMQTRHARVNLPISASDRLFCRPQGRRPDEHPSLTALGL